MINLFIILQNAVQRYAFLLTYQSLLMCTATSFNLFSPLQALFCLYFTTHGLAFLNFISTFANIKALSPMNKYIRRSGLAAIYLGAALLPLGYALGWTDCNAFTLSAAALVVAGTVAHVYFLKKESKY